MRLAPAALATKRIKVGTGIAYSFSRHPIAAAGEASDLAEISDGRLIVGLGGGTKYMRKLWYDIDWEHPAPQMKEYVEIMRACWTATGPVRYDGRFYKISIDLFQRRGFTSGRDIPVLAAALNPAMIRSAAEAYDGVALFPIAIARQYFDQVVMPNVEKGAARARKSARDVRIVPWIITAISKDREEARRTAKHHLGFYFSTRSYGAVADMCGFGKEKDRILEIARANREKPDENAMADAVSDEMVDALCLAGTPDEVRKKVHDFDDRGHELVIEARVNHALSHKEILEEASLIIEALSPK
jgi:alkanesulfonate monooxygenase SsuD/methylene tetrahydromethanopterin reductase-like flavin-dependent oxidoreductase (luciferase family)